MRVSTFVSSLGNRNRTRTWHLEYGRTKLSLHSRHQDSCFFYHVCIEDFPSTSSIEAVGVLTPDIPAFCGRRAMYYMENQGRLCTARVESFRFVLFHGSSLPVHFRIQGDLLIIPSPQSQYGGSVFPLPRKSDLSNQPCTCSTDLPPHL